MENEEIEHEYTDEIVCPWCGYEYGDSWEWDNDDSLDCWECDKPFKYERHVEVTYVSSKDNK